jgi:hypothetical protein
MLASCKTKKDIEPKTALVGKWVATGEMQSQNADGTWSDWYELEILTAVPVSIWEFTSDGRFLRDGKAGASCCFAGDKYKTEGNELIFSELASPCINGFCLICKNWSFNLGDKDTLTLTQCTIRNKYSRVK